jgi:hypothetical protein
MFLSKFFIEFHVEVLKGREINLDTTFFYFSFPEIINNFNFEFFSGKIFFIKSVQTFYSIKAALTKSK